MRSRKFSGYRNVMSAPAFFYKIYGWQLARKGKGACDAYIQRGVEKCCRAEERMCMALEKALSDGRQKAVMLMIELSESARCIQTPPPVPIRGNIASMRAASAAEKDRTLCRLRYRNAAAQLAEISEGITSGTSLLNGNIRSIRRGVSIKLTAFIQGVRSRKNAQLSTYRENEPVSFYGTAFEDYVKSRKPGDDAIRKAVDSCCSDGRKE